MAARDATEPPSGKTVPDPDESFLSRLRELTQLPRGRALARLGYDLKRPLFALPFYGYSLGATPAAALRVTPPDSWPGDAARGAEVVRGSFTLAGRRVEHPAPRWAPAGIRGPWLDELHGFAWLRDLRAAGGDAARRTAREMVADWLDQHARWSATAWAPLTTGRRLAGWIGCYDFYAASAAIDFRHALLAGIGRQAQHLDRVLPAGLAGAEFVAALKGLILAGACHPDGDPWLRSGLRLLCRELPRQVREDGSHVERSPVRHLAVLRDLVDLRATLARLESLATEAASGGPGQRHGGAQIVPVELQAAVDGMAAACRALLHGDGGLALFNGSAEEDAWQVDLVLQRAGGRRRPARSVPESGFQRLRAGRILLLVDAAGPPPHGLDAAAHAGTASFEMSVGRERLVVNCGARPEDPVWAGPARATAAHSTLVVADTNSSEVLPEGLGRRARVIDCRREEADGNHWLELAHDGYVSGFGLVHRRRLYLAAEGNELRGEDRLQPGHAGRDGITFAVRFHLHPDVQASLVGGGDTVLLRLPKGGGWQFQARGAAIALEPGIYLGRRPALRRNLQIVLSGVTEPRGATVKWRLARVPSQRDKRAGRKRKTTAPASP